MKFSNKMKKLKKPRGLISNEITPKEEKPFDCMVKIDPENIKKEDPLEIKTEILDQRKICQIGYF